MRLDVFKNGFAHEVSILTTGSLIAQLFPFILYPIIGRLYTPEQNAVLAAYTSIVAVIQAVSTGKYEYTIFLADTDKDAANIAVLSLLLSIITCFILLLLSTTIPDLFGYVTKIDLSWLIYIMPLSIISITVFDIYNQWCVRKKYFKKLAINKVTSSVGVNLGKVGMAYLPLRSYGLVIGDVIGRILTMFACIIRVVSIDAKIFKCISTTGMLFQAKKFSSFPKFSMPAQLLNTLGASLPILLFSHYYGDTYVGLFSMSLTVLYVPIGVVGCSVRDVFRKKVRDTLPDKAVRPLFIKSSKYISSIAIIAGLIGVWILPWLFSTILGNNWLKSGYFAQIITPLIVMNFISTSLDSTLLVAQKTKQILIWQILYLSCAIIPILIGGGLMLDFEYTLVLYTVFRMISEVTLIIMSYYYACWIDCH